MNNEHFTFLKELLEEKYYQYNQPEFIEDDPIQIPKRFTRKEDIEIAGFLSASIAWGNRKSIIKNALKWMELMDDSPYEFILAHSQKDLQRFGEFKHRTFNAVDTVYFIKSLHNIYSKHGGLEKVFTSGFHQDMQMKTAIANFRKIFFEIPYPQRTQKHIANVEKKSAAKRINMFLRWMVRKDKMGIDFGIWNLPTEKLMLPLDVHTGNISRELGLLSRKQNDWKAVKEVTENLKNFDSKDPVKYDFALFGMGINKDY